MVEWIKSTSTSDIIGVKLAPDFYNQYCSQTIIVLEVNLYMEVNSVGKDDRRISGTDFKDVHFRLKCF